MPYRRPHRLLRHVVTDHLSVARAFTPAVLEDIERAIVAGERTHRGQVCFAVEGALPPLRVLRKLMPRERALEVFGLLRVWDTEENAGVLIYLLLADRGIDRRVDQGEWQAICTRMEAAFAQSRYGEGIVAGVAEISALLARHYPRTADAQNELPDRPVVL